MQSLRSSYGIQLARRSFYKPALIRSAPSTTPTIRRTIISTYTSRQQQIPQEHAHSARPRPSFYRTHGRAFFKAFTLAFLTFQITYWFWLIIETEEIKDIKNGEIKSLESEVRLLDDSRKSHRPAEVGGKRLLEEAVAYSKNRG